MRKNKQKAFVLPSTIVSLVVISLLSILLFSMVLATRTQNKLLERRSSAKLLEEQIFFNFKYNENSFNFDDVTIYEYDCTDDSKDISAIVAVKNGKTICFGIYDFENEAVICYQNSNIDCEIQGEDTFAFGDLEFVKV